MHEGRTVFAQLMDHLPRRTFQRLVKRYRGDSRIKAFTCWDQFLCMAFAQLTYRDSLRDIEACLGAIPEKLYHLGFRARSIARSTLADANEKRDWRLYADLAQRLVIQARRLYVAESIGLEELDEREQNVYALDATIVELCLGVFPWARFRRTKAGIKLHTLLDQRGSIPIFIWITDARYGDVQILDVLIPEPGSIYVFDRSCWSQLRPDRVISPARMLRPSRLASMNCSQSRRSSVCGCRPLPRSGSWRLSKNAIHTRRARRSCSSLQKHATPRLTRCHRWKRDTRIGTQSPDSDVTPRVKGYVDGAAAAIAPLARWRETP